jgi:catechol-2,3-dioxygenase
VKPLLSMALLAAVALAACAPPRVAPSDRPPRIDHLLLEVQNLEASIRFYRDLMGLYQSNGV